MPKTNILFVITKLELGGAQKQLLSLASRLDRGRYDIFLFTCRQGLLMEEALAIGDIHVHRSPFLDRPLRPFADLRAFIELCRFIKQHHIRVVHTHSSKAGILGRWAAALSGVKGIVHTVHGWSFNEYQPALRRRLCIWLERFTAQLTHKLIVVSLCDKHKGLENRIGRPAQYQLIRQGIDENGACGSHNGFRDEVRVSADQPLIGMVACFKPQKCPQDFIRLAALVRQKAPEAKFVLIGDGLLRRQLENLIRQHKLEATVILAGWRKDIWRIIQAIDIFVLTSLWEGLPIAALEAMRCAKPVVATDTGGIAEVVTDGTNGFLVAAHAMQDMADKLLFLLRDNAARQAMGRQAQGSLAGAFSIEAMIEDTDALYAAMAF